MKGLALRAGVAELADAQDLGSCGLKTVEVQILSPAPHFFKIFQISLAIRYILHFMYIRVLELRRRFVAIAELLEQATDSAG